jgi:hypothetical protein
MLDQGRFHLPFSFWSFHPMKIFTCDQCGSPIFFENVQCLRCGSLVAFLPDQLDMGVRMHVSGNNGAWQRHGAADGVQYRMCSNHDLYQACNFAVRADDANTLCVSCRQTRILPDLSIAANRQRWFDIETAKRRLFYTLARLGLVTSNGALEPAQTPVYEFLADIPGMPRVMTGHSDGVITLNVAEADDDERARRRVALHEPYRTLLGHLRHESGHFYWDRLVRDRNGVAQFRAVFGDESADYGTALQAHYATDHSSTAWQEHYVSAYATAHPWEDWAETWAHYLHMVDLLETASSYHTTVEIPGGSAIKEEGVANPFAASQTDFDQLVAQWVPVTLLVNSLNRSLGQNDAYPFALSAGALRKLRYVHDVIHADHGNVAYGHSVYEPGSLDSNAAAPQDASLATSG